MSDCGWLSDRIPAVALGRTEWTPDEIRHLGQCVNCQDEWELVRVASRMGEEVGFLVDTTSTASAVLRRLEHDRAASRVRRRAWRFGGVAAAAVIAATLWMGEAGTRRAVPKPVAPAVAGALSIPLPELETLQPAELDSVLETMDAAVGNGSPPGASEITDLENNDLELVLDSWEG